MAGCLPLMQQVPQRSYKADRAPLLADASGLRRGRGEALISERACVWVSGQLAMGSQPEVAKRSELRSAPHAVSL
jgi:hypothetical protein